MKIIAHRGFWKKPEKQNTLGAFYAAIKKGFGIETDVRDYKGKLVISHDVPNDKKQILLFRDFITKISKMRQVNEVQLAINIKSCGLGKLLHQELSHMGCLKNVFVFDMSVPDMLIYLRKKFPWKVYGRLSEYESDLTLLKEMDGLWLDQFEKNWVNDSKLRELFKFNKELCIVSPELHGRPHAAAWNEYLPHSKNNLAICTDLVEEANIFFNK